MEKIRKETIEAIMAFDKIYGTNHLPQEAIEAIEEIDDDLIFEEWYECRR